VLCVRNILFVYIRSDEKVRMQVGLNRKRWMEIKRWIFI